MAGGRGWGGTSANLLIQITESESMCQGTVRLNNTKTLEFGVEKGLLQGYARRQEAHALKKTPKFLKDFQQSPLIGKVREGRG